METAKNILEEHPSSIMHCRPIGFKIKKENVQNMKEVYNKVQT